MKKQKTTKKIIGFALAVMLMFALIPMTATINAEGITVKEIATGLEYFHIGFFVDGAAFISDGGVQRGIIDKTGRVIIPFDTYHFPAMLAHFSYDGFSIAHNEDGAGIIDTKGNIVIPFGTYRYYDMSHFNDGMAIVLDEDWYSHGLIDITTGNFIIPFGTYHYTTLRDSIVGVENANGQMGVIDKTGKIIIPFGTYSYIAPSGDGMATVRNANGQQGVIDITTGQIVVPFGTYRDIWWFRDGFALAQNANGQLGLIDTTGKVVIPFGIYDRINNDSFSNGLATIQNANKQWGVIDITTGNLVIPFGTYDMINAFKDGLAAAQKANDDTWVILEIVSDDTAPEPAPEPAPTPTPAAQPSAPQTARPTSATVLINGENAAFDAYNIEGNNYFKLRDLAFVLSGTEKQFNVGWDRENNAIALTSGEAYDIVGGEMEPSTTEGNRTATPTTSEIYLDGELAEFTAYLIGGNNYFKLRDVMETFDVYVGWDGASNTITLDTSMGYES